MKTDNDPELESVARASGFIRSANPRMDIWEPVMMSVEGNIFSVHGADNNGETCSIEVCSLNVWKPTPTEHDGASFTEDLPLEDCASYFACSGFVNGTRVYETVVCVALDAHGTWMGVLSVAMSHMPLLHLQALKAHDEKAHAEVVHRFGLVPVGKGPSGGGGGSGKSGWFPGKAINRIIASSSSQPASLAPPPLAPSPPSPPPTSSSSDVLSEVEEVLRRKVAQGTLSAEECGAILARHREIATHDDHVGRDVDHGSGEGGTGSGGDGIRAGASAALVGSVALGAPPAGANTCTPPQQRNGASSTSSTFNAAGQPSVSPPAFTSAASSGGGTKGGAGEQQLKSASLVSDPSSFPDVGGGGGLVPRGNGNSNGEEVYAFFPHYAALFAAGWVAAKFGWGVQVVAMTPALLAFLLAAVFFLGQDSTSSSRRGAASGEGVGVLGRGAGVGSQAAGGPGKGGQAVVTGARALFEAKKMKMKKAAASLGVSGGGVAAAVAVEVGSVGGSAGAVDGVVAISGAASRDSAGAAGVDGELRGAAGDGGGGGGGGGGACWETDGWRDFEKRSTVLPLVPFSRGQLFEDEEFHSAVEALQPETGNRWSQPPGQLFWCRGKHYLQDRNKFTSREPFFPLVGMDLWKVVPLSEGGAGPQRHVSLHPQSYVQKVLRDPSSDPHVCAFLRSGNGGGDGGGNGNDDGDDDDDGLHFFVVSFLLPWGNFVAYFLRPKRNPVGSEAEASNLLAEAKAKLADLEDNRPSVSLEQVDEEDELEAAVQVAEERCAELKSRALARKLYEEFVASGDDQYRDERLKILPRVFDGPWLVKRAVGKGNKAAKLAEHIELSYPNSHSGGPEEGSEAKAEDASSPSSPSPSPSSKGTVNPHWCEVEVDVSQSAFGNRVLGVVKTYINSVSIDLGFMVEGVTDEELPERVLGALRFHSLDLPNAPFLPYLDTSRMHPIRDSAALDPEQVAAIVANSSVSSLAAESANDAAPALNKPGALQKKAPLQAPSSPLSLS